MTARIHSAKPQPDITTGVQHLFKAIYAGGVPAQTLELVHLRASQINGCSACVDAGAARAAESGVDPKKLVTVAAWYENPLFDDAERAALALTVTAPGRSDSRVAASVSASAARSASSNSGFSYQAATPASFSGLTPALVAPA